MTGIPDQFAVTAEKIELQFCISSRAKVLIDDVLKDERLSYALYAEYAKTRAEMAELNRKTGSFTANGRNGPLTNLHILIFESEDGSESVLVATPPEARSMGSLFRS